MRLSSLGNGRRRRTPPARCPGDVLRDARRRVVRAGRASRSGRSRLAVDADRARARRPRGDARPRGARRTISGLRRAGPRRRWNPGTARVHERDRGGQLLSGRRRGRTLRDPDDRAHRRSTRRTARRRRSADDRSDRPLRTPRGVVARPRGAGRHRAVPVARVGRRCLVARRSWPGATEPGVP